MTLKSKLLIIFLSVTLSSLLSAWFLFYAESRRALEGVSSEKTLEEARRLSMEIDSRLDALKTVFLVWKRYLIQGNIDTTRLKGGSISWRALNASVEELLLPSSYPGQSICLKEYFARLVVLDSKRVPQIVIEQGYATRREAVPDSARLITWLGQEARDRCKLSEEFVLSLEARPITLQAPEIGLSGFVMRMATPVLLEPGEASPGLIVTELNISRIFQDSLTSAGATSQHPLFVTDRNGTILHHTDLNKIYFQIDDVMPEYSALKASIRDGKETAITVTLEGGEPNIVALYPSRYGHWLVGRVSPYGEFWKSAERAARIGLLLLTAVGALSFISIVVLTRGITRTVSKLKQGTEEFARGNLDFKIRLSRRDELGELAHAYNHMAESVALHQRNLTERIEEIKSLYDAARQFSPHLEEESLTEVLFQILCAATGGARSILFLRDDYAGKWHRGASQGLPVPDGSMEVRLESFVPPSLQEPCFLPRAEGGFLHELVQNDEKSFLLAVPLLIENEMEGLFLSGGLLAEDQPDRERILYIHSLALLAAGAVDRMRMIREMVSNAELAALNRASSLLAHDLNNLIGRLSVITQNAKKMIDKPAFLARLPLDLEDTIEKFDSAIKQLLNPTSGEARSLEAADLNKIIEDALSSIEPVRRPDIRVEKNLGSLSPVPLYKDDFRRMLENLFKNAVDAMPDGGTLSISTEPEEGDRILLTISDTGCGMSKDFVQKKLFRPFATTKKKGMGIGLYTAFQLIRELGGTLSVSSREGQGTVLSITLPSHTG
jgi:signal transduction histidine kinase